MFHVLNRGNGRQTLCFGSADHETLVRIVKEALLIVPMQILGYCLMPCGPNRPAPWTQSHTLLTWTTAEEEFIAGKRYFT